MMEKGKKIKQTKDKEELEFKPKHIAELNNKLHTDANKYGQKYIDFLNNCKTERETVKYIQEMAVKTGYKKFDKNTNYKPGDKVYLNIKDKSIILSTIGDSKMKNGVCIVASHVDSPRIDLKTRPLYSDSELAMFKTHYYGGIKKHHWITIPLALHGVIVDKREKVIDVKIGGADDDTTFCITDLLPHLERMQDRDRMWGEVIAGEQLNVIAGSIPFKDKNENGDSKFNILKILNKKYNITEEDLICADLSLVPAFDAKNIGLDRSLIGGYGQDDKVCVYASLIAELQTKNNQQTTVSVFTDREEIGSDGNTGLASDMLKNYLNMLCKIDINTYLECIENSICLSADVKAAFDPTWAHAYERNNCGYLNHGVCISRYTGGGGKAGTSEARAEFTRRIVNTLNKNEVAWQTSSNKVDQGGGGTVARFIANLGIEVIDIGVPILSMHSPYEIVSKLDAYMMFKAISAFLETNEI